MNRLFTVFCVLSALAGCAGHRYEPVPTAASQSIEFNSAGQKSFLEGDADEAIEQYDQAMRLSRSIEDPEGIAANLINMAVILKDSGQQQRAVAKLDEVIKSQLIAYPSELIAEAAYIKAKIYLEYSSDRNGAAVWAQRAREECAKRGCKAEGRIFNLSARIAYWQGQYTEAIDWAQKGQSSSRGAGSGIEAANSIRIMADARLALKEFESALGLFEQALESDKGQGHSKKIMRDLMGVGYCLEGLKQNDKALTFFRRAIVIASYSKDDKILGDASMAISRIMNVK